MARIAKTVKNDLSTLKQSCVGKKMKGFKFADTPKQVYVTDMNKFIGEVGKIKEYYEDSDEFGVQFKDSIWYYPATKALKHIVEEPKVSDEELVTVQEIIDETYIAMLKADIEDLSAKLDQAYREQEQMLDELREWINAFPGAFTKLVKHAGQITEEDVTYHTNIVLRVMEHKFGYKSKSEE
jgi:hypothetical protein